MISKIIVKIPHLKAKKSAGGLVEYIAKREGVDKSVNGQVVIAKPTEKQMKYINELLKLCPGAKESYEYEDYMENPTKQNASALISVIAESNPQIFSDRETYLNYIATRPNVEKYGEHGLFGVEDTVELAKVKAEVSDHNGVIWTPIVSLRREDASRLGYDNAEMWQALIRAKQMDLAAAFGIPDEDFRWYGAFHNEGYHPHMHMVVYSAGSKRGFLREKDIEKVKSILANEIFKNDMYELYDEKTQAREKISDESKKRLAELAEQIQYKDCSGSEVCEMLVSLAEKLKPLQGKKQYGYLPKPLKKEVDEIVQMLAADADIQNLYAEWCNIQRKIVNVYKDQQVEFPPLWENKEFKKIRNAVIAEAVTLGDDRISFEPHDEALHEDEVSVEREIELEMEPGDSQEEIELEAEGLELENPLDFVIPSAFCCEYKEPYKQARRLLYREKAYETAYHALVEQVKRGNVPAMFDLGKMYQNNLYVEQDGTKADYLFRHALRGYLQFEQKKPSDFYEYQIGRIYALKTVFQDYAAARKWFTLSAGRGNAYAMFALGNLYYYGNGTDIDYKKAFAYLHSSAENFCVHAFFRLGYMLRKGIGCDENIRESDKWFSRMIANYAGSIEKLEAMNCYRLGQLYEKGWGCKKNAKVAMQYYAEACKSNHADAEFALGRLYLMQGEAEQGEEYINRAIEHGNAYAEEWYENWQAYLKNVSQQDAVNAVGNLFCRFASVIDNDAKQKIDGHNKTIVDSKERMELLKKKQRLGIKMG